MWAELSYSYTGTGIIRDYLNMKYTPALNFDAFWRIFIMFPLGIHYS